MTATVHIHTSYTYLGVPELSFFIPGHPHILRTGAPVDLCFNIGAHAFATSTLVTLLNAGDFNGAALELDKWDHANGKVIAGLLRRREAETALFNQV
jgi:GH24 family phage-related lysozyme (muramidase)